MIRLFPFLFLVQTAASRIDYTLLHSLNLTVCDVVPTSSYRIAADTKHYFIGTDGSVTTDDVAHIFSLLDCALPTTSRAFLHSFPLIGDRSKKLCTTCELYEFMRRWSEDFKVPTTAASIRQLCRFLHYTQHPRNSVVLLFMRPFTCNVGNLPDVHTRRMVFIQTTTDKEWIGITEDRLKAYYLNLETPNHLAVVHSLAHDLLALSPPLRSAFDVPIVAEYSEEQSASLIAILLTFVIVLISWIIFCVLICITIVNATAVKNHYEDLALEWDDLRQRAALRRERAGDAVVVEVAELTALSVSTARGRTLTAVSMSLSSTALSPTQTGETMETHRGEVNDWHFSSPPFPSVSLLSMNSGDYYTPAASPLV